MIFSVNETENQNLKNFEKKCSKCEQIKNISDFNKDASKKCGIRSNCKQCEAEYYKNNRNKYLENCKEYRKNNKEKCAEIKKNYKKKKYHSSPKFRLHELVSRRVRKSLSCVGGKNGKSTFEILGYSIEQLQKHLEQQFESWMTWEQYGKTWHVDHIVPVSFFDFSSTEDPVFMLCWSLDNLRPLEAKENIIKGNTMDTENFTEEIKERAKNIILEYKKIKGETIL